MGATTPPAALGYYTEGNMIQDTPRTPRVAHLSWGRLEVEGYPPFKDAKVFPGGAREWEWRETGTHHSPGIQPSDVDELIDHGVQAVVLSKGLWERLQVCPETLKLLADHDIAVDVLQTEAAVNRFNELRERVPVGGLFHSTC
ncbi:MAG: Mth938-like domain-containing protein [Geminicoccaceae bacterium]